MNTQDTLHHTDTTRESLIPVSQIKKPRKYQTRLDDGVLVNQATGEIFLRTPAVDMHFPMLVVRHGQTDGNIRRVFQGQIDQAENRLNATGREQVKRAATQLYTRLTEILGDHLTEFASSGRLVLLTSPLTRAQETAKAFTDYFKQQTGISLQPDLEEDLAEMYFGAIEGHAIEDIEDEELKALTERFKRSHDAVIDWKGTGESFFDVMARANHLLERLNEQYHGQNVLVISFAHGTLINALRVVSGDSALIEENGFVAFRKHHLDNAQACWLGRSEQLAERLQERTLQRTA